MPYQCVFVAREEQKYSQIRVGFTFSGPTYDSLCIIQIDSVVVTCRELCFMKDEYILLFQHFTRFALNFYYAGVIT
jgi:hypothetical protein